MITEKKHEKAKEIAFLKGKQVTLNLIETHHNKISDKGLVKYLKDLKKLVLKELKESEGEEIDK